LNLSPARSFYKARAFLSATSEAAACARFGTQKSIANPVETKTFATQTVYRVGYEHKKAQEKAWALHRPNGLNGVKAT
jgi:hypothetical protein